MEALTDEQARAIATNACKRIDRQAAGLVLLMSAPREFAEKFVTVAANLPVHEARSALAEVVALDKTANVARQVVRQCIHHPEVRAALSLPAPGESMKSMRASRGS